MALHDMGPTVRPTFRIDGTDQRAFHNVATRTWRGLFALPAGIVTACSGMEPRALILPGLHRQFPVFLTTFRWLDRSAPPELMAQHPPPRRGRVGVDVFSSSTALAPRRRRQHAGAIRTSSRWRASEHIG